jgi:hypothetical protein
MNQVFLDAPRLALRTRWEMRELGNDVGGDVPGLRSPLAVLKARIPSKTARFPPPVGGAGIGLFFE